jgi:molybdate transport system substrate-binding protein
MTSRAGNERRSPSVARRSFAALCALLVLALGCDGREPETKAAPPSENPAAPETELLVFAAASLRDAFTQLSKSFEAAHPGTRVVFNFAGTQELRTQLEHGARADVFASADQKHMDALAKASLVSQPVLFARNEPVVVVAAHAAERIRTFADVPLAERIVVGAPEVPIGRYTLQILDRAGATLGADFRARVEAKLASRELNVRQVLAKVTLGEADLAFVYRSDAMTAAVRPAILTIPADINVIAQYPIARLSDAPHPALARDWVDRVLGADGQRALEAAGFLPRGAT